MMRLARVAAGSAHRASAFTCTNNASLQLRHVSTLSNAVAHSIAQPHHRHSDRCAQLHTHCCAAHAASDAVAPAAASSAAATANAAAPTAAAAAATRPPVRVRYAPSPTGSVHLGGLRTALYNYLFAKKKLATASTDAAADGKFLVRIEDTDQKRLVPGAVDELLVALRWAGIVNDEGPGAVPEGDVGPYVQSQRLPLYQKHVQTLLDGGHAYPCFCSAERLTELRDLQTKKGLPSMYDRLCLGMEEEERAAKLQEAKEKGLPYVIRMKIPHGTTTVRDMIRGQVTFPNKTLDDQVLLKSDGFPTYHLACVVDDHLMRISHVIRGDEWLTSTPKHVLLYRQFGWSVPQFAHLPLLLKPDGTKLSKRHADSSLEYYISRGYLPEAVVNFVALLGWNPGTTQEVFSIDQLVEAFSLERIQKAGAVVSLPKLDWFNQQHLQRMATTRLDELLQLVQPKLAEFHSHADAAAVASSSGAPMASAADLACPAYLRRVVLSLASHVTHVQDFVSQSVFYYRVPHYQSATDDKIKLLQSKVYSDAPAKELNSRMTSHANGQQLVASTITLLESLPDSAFILGTAPASDPPSSAAPVGSAAPAAAAPSIQEALKTVFKKHNVKQKTYFLLLRYILSGSESGPSLSVMIGTLGRERALQRLRNEAAFTPSA